MDSRTTRRYKLHVQGPANRVKVRNQLAEFGSASIILHITQAYMIDTQNDVKTSLKLDLWALAWYEDLSNCTFFTIYRQ